MNYLKDIAIGGIVAALMVKIIWDWLKKGRTVMTTEAKEKIEAIERVIAKHPAHCPEHGDCMKEFRTTKECLNHFKREYAASEATHHEREVTVLKRLDVGEKTMQKMQSSIHGIDLSVQKILTILENNKEKGIT